MSIEANHSFQKLSIDQKATNLLTLNTLESITSLADKTLPKKLLVHYPEKQIDYICYSYFKNFENLRKENAILKEIADLTFQTKDLSHVLFIVISVYLRELELEEAVKMALPVQGAVSLLLRYLYLMLLGFSKMRLVSSTQAVELADCFRQILIQIKGNDYDKQKAYYILKISELVCFKDKPTRGLTGLIRKKFTLLTQFKRFKEERQAFEKSSFWENYYKQNNYFYENNPTLFEELRKKGTETGIEKMVARSEQGVANSDLLESITDQKGVLSHWGIRASSLGDVIRYMAYMDISLDNVNIVCLTLAEKFNMDKRMAYQVILELEDEFSFNDSYQKNISGKKKVENVNQNLCILDYKSSGGFWKSITPYLGILDVKELQMVSKNMYSTLKDPLIRRVLSSCEINIQQRIEIWGLLIPESTRAKQLQEPREIPSEKNLEIIMQDLNRSKLFFPLEDLPKLHKILFSIAQDFPDLSYYQGMNYIAIYLLRLLGDETKAYHMLNFLAEEFIEEKFGDQFNGLFEQLYICDKYLQIYQKDIWKQMSKAKITSMYFGVPFFITLVTNMIQLGEEVTPFLGKVIDLVIAGGAKALIATFLYLIILQKMNIVTMQPDLILMALLNMDKSPLPAMEYQGVAKDSIVAFIKSVSKADLMQVSLKDELYQDLVQHYQLNYKKVVRAWQDHIN